MNPINFEEQTTLVAEHQDMYGTLPAFITAEGAVISKWKLSWKERFTILITGHVWMWLYTFHQPVQPSKLTVTNPFPKVK